MNSNNNLKVLLFDTILNRLCDMMIEDGTPDELLKFFEEIGKIAEQNGYDRKLLVPTCATGLRKVMAEVEANEDPNRKSNQTQVMRMALRFLTFYYMLAQIRPTSLEENEKWALDIADIPEKDRSAVWHHHMSLFLLMVPDSEIKKVFKGKELKNVREWRKRIKG